MVVEYPLYGESCTLAITLFSDSETNFALSVQDADNSGVVLTDRTGVIKGQQVYYVRMPICPDIALIDVQGQSSEVEIDDLEVMHLPTDFSSELFKRQDVQNFINFAEEFAYNANYIDANKSYYSDDERYEIKYLEVIIEDGEVDPTPARISQKTGIIEVSQKDFLRYTIPMRVAILLHEFAHFYVNEVMEDEVEADKHSLTLYMGLGYPRIDAYNVYLDVFETTPTEGNKERYDALQKLFNEKYVA